jgi:hypothetical protein
LALAPVTSLVVIADIHDWHAYVSPIACVRACALQ